MPPNRKPAAALRANGSRHYSKAQLDEREKSEVQVPDALKENIAPPSYLTGTLVEEFNELAPALSAMGVLTALDVDTLAQFLIARKNYIRTTNKLTPAITAGNARDADRWSTMQDRFLKQMRNAAADLGLTVSSRCNLNVAPPATVKTDSEEVDLFGEDG